MKDELILVPKRELEDRLARLRARMDAEHPGWSMIFIHHKVNMYYLAGTMQEGVLVVRPEDEILWVRRSYVRGRKESLLNDVRPMKSFRTLAEHYGNHLSCLWIEGDQATFDWIAMVRKYFSVEEMQSVCPVMQYLRARKSAYELDLMKRAGAIHQEVMEKLAPTFLREGISEAELGIEIYREMIRRGGHGIVRFHMPMGEDVIGLVSFGKSGLVPMAFDGPGGTAGTCVAVQSLGSAARRLKPGTVVYFDIASGVEGYHSDKSIVFYFGDLDQNPRGEEIRRANNFCVDLEHRIAAMLRPGAIPAEIYQSILPEIPAEYADGFMSGGKFLGHSIGLTMDETPVLAKPFTQPLEENMTFAVEPKIALPGVGLVGTENTYLVTPEGGVSLTGHAGPLRAIRAK
jgi:Xaa-Pro dipeptidase